MGTGNGKVPTHDLSVLDDWLFLVGGDNDAGVLARATDRGLKVSRWDNRAELLGLRDRKVIMVLRQIGEERDDELDAIGLVQSIKPSALNIWKPFGLGSDETPTITELASKYDLGNMLWAERPWEHSDEIKRGEKRGGWPLTDLGNAERLVNTYGASIRYCKPWQKWLRWTGRRWKIDQRGQLEQMAKKTVRRILKEALAAKDETESKAIAKWAIRSEGAKSIGDMLKLAWSEVGIPIIPDELDQSPWLLNVRNGTVDLKTGELRTPKRNDWITLMTAAEIGDSTDDCPVWSNTLRRIFDGNPDLIGFWRRLCGLCLTGIVSEQILPILWGAGANGKSTILTVLLEILGPDYGIAAPPGLLVVRKGEQHPTERASLYRKRLVVDMESAEGARLNESWVKQLTGSDKISCRRMREDFWEFSPTHKVLMGTNHKPRITETKNAIWRRIKLIPFAVTIPDEEQDRELAQKLRMEYPSILRWCVEGCLEWQSDGLNIPEEINLATREYRSEQDVLGDFIANECIENTAVFAPANALYQRYVSWCEQTGERAISMTLFGVNLIERGFRKEKSSRIIYYGIGLRPKSED